GVVPSDPDLADQGRSTSRGAEHSPERWHKRTFDLFTRHPVTPITNPPSAYPSNTVRILDDDERELELEQWVYTWHVPGPTWDGERVVWEPTPPDGWLELNASSQHSGRNETDRLSTSAPVCAMPAEKRPVRRDSPRPPRCAGSTR
ncbi:hypothetical protein, partial [Streptomyces olivaceoviridis]